MSVTVKAAVLVMVILTSLSVSITARAEDRGTYGRLEDSEPEEHEDRDGLARKKPLFQTKFFSEE